MNTLASHVRESPIRVVVAHDHPVVRGMVRSALDELNVLLSEFGAS
jgi:hypothetical protein